MKKNKKDYPIIYISGGSQGSHILNYNSKRNDSLSNTILSSNITNWGEQSFQRL
jgi:hypothetical protein